MRIFYSFYLSIENEIAHALILILSMNYETLILFSHFFKWFCGKKQVQFGLFLRSFKFIDSDNLWSSVAYIKSGNREANIQLCCPSKRTNKFLLVSYEKLASK